MILVPGRGYAHRMTSLTLSVCVLTATAITSGCSFTSPDVVADNYAPSDGLNADLPDLKIRNLLVVGNDAEAAGVLSATLLNLTDAELSVTLTTDDGSLDQTVQVPADTTLTLVGADTLTPTENTDIVVIDPLGVLAGSAVAIDVDTPGGGTITLEPPVLRAEGAYETYVP